MFYDSDLNVPPCCDQKYFRALWSELQVRDTTILWHGADYNLQRIVDMATTRFMMCNLTIAVPELTDDFLNCLFRLMSHTYWNSEDPKGTYYWLQSLKLIAPQEEFDRIGGDEALKDIFGKAYARASFHPAPFTYTTFIVNNSKSQPYAFIGSTYQSKDYSGTERYCLTVSKAPSIVQEVSTILRVSTHKKLKQKDNANTTQ